MPISQEDIVRQAAAVHKVSLATQQPAAPAEGLERSQFDHTGGLPVGGGGNATGDFSMR